MISSSTDSSAEADFSTDKGLAFIGQGLNVFTGDLVGDLAGLELVDDEAVDD